MWAALEAMAPTLVHDALQMGDGELPAALARPHRNPRHPQHRQPRRLRSAVAITASTLPNAHLAALDGQFHQVSQDVLVEAFKNFFR